MNQATPLTNEAQTVSRAREAKSEKVVTAIQNSKWIIGWLIVSIFIQQTAVQTCFAIRMDAQSYQRARFYDSTNGRFNRLDPFAGNANDPQSFHKYAYVHGDPIQGVDPTGMFFGLGTIAAIQYNAQVLQQGLLRDPEISRAVICVRLPASFALT